MDEEHIASIARALGHPARLRILHLLAAQDACRGSEIFESLPLAQSTISQHLSVLRKAGLVNASPRGQRTVYCIAEGPLADLADVLDDLIAEHPDCPGEDA
ncbi:MAG TPA: metalloregulator ArsR/SmtB family transcription factor [Coriobacteriia bacterium]|nr:metalloregulator ArsR/SmtB family transcription factor [Coriobacteriia bacterium]